MKKELLMMMAACFAMPSMGTENANSTTIPKDTIITIYDTVMPEGETTRVDDQKIFDVVEKMPSFGTYTYEEKEITDPTHPEKFIIKTITKTGEEGLIAYLNRNIKYPLIAEENGIQGRVVCTFVVERDGSITDIQVIKSVDPSLDKEAKRVIGSMPKWNPGIQKGVPVRVKFTLPVTFRLQTAGAQIDKPKEEKTVYVAKKDKMWYTVTAKFSIHKQYPELQKAFGNILFGIEDASLQNAFHSYLNTYEKCTIPQEKEATMGCRETFTVKYLSGEADKYLCYRVSHVKTSKEDKRIVTQKNDIFNIIFDVKQKKILTLEDVLLPDKVAEVKGLIGGAFPQMHMDNEKISIGCMKNGKMMAVEMFYELYINAFTEEFKQKLDWETIVQRAEKKVYDYVDENPTFPGGDNEMIKWIKANINYPEEAKTSELYEILLCSSIVGKDGSLSDIKVNSSKTGESTLANELSHLLEQMPKWNPGVLYGCPVRALRTFAITFAEGDIILGDKSKVLDIVEQMPQFRGGDAALMEYLNKAIKYPPVAEATGIQGRVVTTFVVERDGSITDVKVIKSVDPSLDREAFRVVRSMPRWIPGKQKGSPVRVKFTLPVTFRLQ